MKSIDFTGLHKHSQNPNGHIKPHRDVRFFYWNELSLKVPKYLYSIVSTLL